MFPLFSPKQLFSVILPLVLIIHAYLFANRRANRIKVLVHDGSGIWLAARRLHQGKFVWPAPGDEQWQLEPVQLDALVLGLPWQRMGNAGIITMV